MLFPCTVIQFYDPGYVMSILRSHYTTQCVTHFENKKVRVVLSKWGGSEKKKWFIPSAAGMFWTLKFSIEQQLHKMPVKRSSIKCCPYHAYTQLKSNNSMLCILISLIRLPLTPFFQVYRQLSMKSKSPVTFLQRNWAYGNVMVVNIPLTIMDLATVLSSSYHVLHLCVKSQMVVINITEIGKSHHPSSQCAHHTL